MTTLTIRGLRKAYGADTPVLRDVDLEVPGGLTSVLGSSGCGKTTLLRIVAGFLEPDAGTIALDGTVVAGDGRSVSPRRRRVGYVPQEGALFPHLDVAGNIAFGLPRSARSHGHRLEEMLDLVELPRTIRDRRPHELSGGQQQRVALARALAPEPDVVLLDEPFSSLDAGLRESTGQAVARALRASGTTGVLVTHDQGEALSLSDQVAVMREGRLVQVAAPTDLYLSPVDSTVAGFVGGAVLLDADVDGRAGTCAIGRLDVRPSTVDGTHGPAGAARVAIRPEQIALHPDAVRGVPAEVVGVSFFGHDTTVQTRVIPDGPTVVARISGGRIPATGEKVGLEVTGDVIAFPAEPVR